jgi:hypothetical protein
MNIRINNFGESLLGRPAGREAFLMAKAYIFKKIKSEESIVLDFHDIKVLTPSWLEEFITGIKLEYSNNIQYINITENQTVEESLKIVLV